MADEDDSIAGFFETVGILCAIAIVSAIVACLYICISQCDRCNKEQAEDQHNKGIDKSVFKKENDWWVESGGPPVTNEGKIATDLDLDQYPEKTEDQYLSYKINGWGQSQKADEIVKRLKLIDPEKLKQGFVIE